VRLHPDRLAAIDAWIAKQDASMTRPEAEIEHGGLVGLPGAKWGELVHALICRRKARP
jgi:hypothetical protein